MRNDMERMIRNGIDDCLSGVEARPSLESRVLERLHGQRRAPVKLSAAMVFALLVVLLTATALAVGGLSGWFRVDQQQVGAMHSCVSDGDTLYLLTTEGLHSWQPGQETPVKLISAEEFAAEEVSSNGILCLKGDKLFLLNPETQTLLRVSHKQLHREADYSGSQLTDDDLRLANAVFQGKWLIIRAVPKDAPETEACLFRWHLPSGKMERLPAKGVVEMCAYTDDKVLVLHEDLSAGSRQVLLSVLDAEGKVEKTLFSGPVQSVENLMAHPKTGQICAFVDGASSLWNGTQWEAMQGYALPVYTQACALVGEGVAAINFNDLQVIPFGTPYSMPTLRIQGLIPLNNEDVTFQQQYPGIAVQREKNPALKASDVRRAIAEGDTTDLFHVVPDEELVSMFRDGTLEPLPSSALLTEDSQAMLPAFRDGVMWDGAVYAVPSRVLITVWESEEPCPDTFEGLMQAQTHSRLPYIASGRAGGTWTKAHYADFLLTSFISAFGREEPDFHVPAFADALRSLRDANFSEISQADKPVITADAAVDLKGKSPVAGEGFRDYTSETSGEEELMPKWQLPCAIAEGIRPVVPAQLTVYVLNPNAANPGPALMYLESIAANRSPETEALLKPMSAVAVLHPGVEAQIEWMIREQKDYETEHGLAHDEAGLEGHISAIKSAPDSWAVEESRLRVYREKIAPCVSLQLHPLLTRQARGEGGMYDRMMQLVLRYVNGEGTLEECLQMLDALMRE